MSDALSRLQARFEEWKDDPDYELEGVLLDVTEQIARALIAQGMKRSELAERLGTSRAYVTKLLDGQENMTLKTLVRVANALEMKVDTRFIPREQAARPVGKARVKADMTRASAKPAAKQATRTSAKNAPKARTAKRAVAARSKR